MTNSWSPPVTFYSPKILETLAFTDPTPRSSKPAPGHVKCEKCSGMGFQQTGTFGNDRKFPKCQWCKGLGQKYLDR